MKLPLSPLVFLLALTVTTRAELTLPAFFSDHMVLQAGANTPIWGKARPHEKVLITLAGRSITATADANGKWRVDLPPQKESLNTDLTIEAPGSKKIIHDVLWGEVWLCSGQSNMARIIEQTNNAPQVVAAAQDPQLRMFTVEPRSMHELQDDLKGEWQLTTPKNAQGFSGVAYFFGKKLRETTKKPVGLFVSAYGGSFIKSWMDRQAMEADPETKAVMDTWNQYVQSLPAQEEKYKAALKIWEAEKAKTDGQPATPKPNPPNYTADYSSAPTNLYNAMLHPLVGYSIRGFLWYQGESDGITPPDLYAKSFFALIKSWRHLWNNDQLPFYFVQIANYMPPPPTVWHWPELREIQRQALVIPKTGMAVSIDIGDANDLHPKNKKDVGERLARIALVNEYGQKMEFSGPMIRAVKFNQGKTLLEFDHAKNLKTTDGQPPLSFEVGDEAGTFKPAKATIVNGGIVLGCAEIPVPKSVRYAWAPSPPVNLVNGDSLPASPFKMDIP
ncbi:MAG: sialate O-acetylesterase [Chthoniobacterales bacterium]